MDRDLFSAVDLERGAMGQMSGSYQAELDPQPWNAVAQRIPRRAINVIVARPQTRGSDWGKDPSKHRRGPDPAAPHRRRNRRSVGRTR